MNPGLRDKMLRLGEAAARERERQAYTVFSAAFKPDVTDSPNLHGGVRYLPRDGGKCSRCGKALGYGDAWLLVCGEDVCYQCAKEVEAREPPIDRA